MNKVFNILAFAVFALCLFSCQSADEPSPAPSPDLGPDGYAGSIGFEISLGDGLTSRAPSDGDYDRGNSYENYIDLTEPTPDIWLAIYDDNNRFVSLIESPMIVPLESFESSKRYLLKFDLGEDIAGSIDNKPFRILMMANCRNKYPKTPGQLDLMNEWWGVENYINYPTCPAGIIEKEDKIPMFGVCRFSPVKLDPKATVQLNETLHLLRALAKIDVYEHEETSYAVTKAELVRRTTICRPFPIGITHQDQYVKGSYENDYVADGALNAAETESTAPVQFKEININGVKSFRLYCPVYRNINSKGNPRSVAERSRIKLTFENGDVRCLEFRDYDMEAEDLNSYFNVERNYWYKFQVKKKDDIIVTVQVVPYAEVDLKPGFGIGGEKDYVPVYDEDGQVKYWYDPDNNAYYDPKTGNRVYPYEIETDPGTGYTIIRDDNRQPFCLYDMVNKQYYMLDRVTKIEDPYNNIDAETQWLKIIDSETKELLYYYDRKNSKWYTAGKIAVAQDSET